MKLPEINFDDFYKFATSSAVLFLITSFVAFVYVYVQDKMNPVRYMLVIVMVISTIILLYVSHMWYNKRQRLLDTKLSKEVEYMELQNNLLRDIYNQKIDIEYLKAELEKIVNPLLKNSRVIKEAVRGDTDE